MELSGNPRIVFTGATGLMGGNLVPLLSGCAECHPVGHQGRYPSERFQAVDLVSADATAGLLETLQPDIIIHAVALTNVDVCETDRRRAYRLTVQTTRNIVEWIQVRRPRTRLVYISTDQVYDGRGPHAEHQINPPNMYGLTKLWAEDLARSVEHHLVLRTNFFALGRPEPRGFADWLIESLLQQKTITLFDDVFFNPLYLSDYADILVELLERGVTGLYNIGAAEGLSKAAFALALAETFGSAYEHATIGSVGGAPLAAYRPNDMRMDTGRLERVLGRSLPTVAKGLARLYQDYQTLRK